jgi:hypothetical protein
MAIFGKIPEWKERALLYMATDSTMKGLVYIIPEEVIGFEVPTVRSAETILFRVRTNLNRAKGFLDEVIYGKHPIKTVAEKIRKGETVVTI